MLGDSIQSQREKETSVTAKEKLVERDMVSFTGSNKLNFFFWNMQTTSPTVQSKMKWFLRISNVV